MTHPVQETLIRTSLVCPVCDMDAKTELLSGFYHFEDVDFDLVHCNGCSLIHVHPMPGDAMVKKMYGDHYFQTDFIAGRYEGTYEEILEKRKPEMTKILEQMERHIPDNKRSLFEVGAAGGMFLKCARDRGWTVGGMEISQWGPKHARETYEIKLTQGNFLEQPLQEITYPVIFFGDVFEHLVDPALAITKIKRALLPGGFIVMLLPMYISSWTFRVFIALAPILRALPLPKNLKVLLKVDTNGQSNPPYHVFEYSKRTISQLLQKNGFEMITVQGNLPIPEPLQTPASKESLSAQCVRSLALHVYKGIKFASETFNFPLVRSLVIAKKR